MDDRRRTISSEEQIGEALMRVSNTLEAQRLTKSLEYQEKLRRRTVFRMTLSIILAITLLLLLVVGGVLLYVLWKYMDPVLEKLVPFLGKVFSDFGIMWDSLVESSTYMPALLNQTTKILDELIVTMQNMHGLPLKEMLCNLNNLLATTNGLMVSTNGLLNGLASGMGPLMSTANDMMVTTNGLMAKTGGLIDGTGALMSTANDGLGTINGLASQTGGLIDGAGDLMATTNDGLKTFNGLAAGAGEMTNNIVDDIGKRMDLVFTGVGDLGEKLGAIGAKFDPILDATTDLTKGAVAMMNSISEALGKFKPEQVKDLKLAFDETTKALPGIMRSSAEGLSAFNACFEGEKNAGRMENLVSNTVDAMDNLAALGSGDLLELLKNYLKP